MVEQGINNQMERDAWLHMQWIGQQQTEPATSVVILTTINLVIQNTLLMKQSPMPTALGVLQNADCENIHLDANPVHGSLIGKNSPQALRSSVFGQYNDVMDISQFEIFLYFTLIDLHIFSSWVGSWVSGFNLVSILAVLSNGVWTSGFALLEFRSLLG